MSRLSRAARRLARRLPDGWASRARTAWTRLRPPRMTVGIGRGLRFDPGRSNRAYATGDNELPVQRALAADLRPGDVVFDVGANVGFLTIIAARLVGPAGHVFAFEPVAANRSVLHRNVRRNRFGNVTVIGAAVGDHSGRAELVLAAYSGGAALASVERPPDATTTIEVDIVSVDDAIFQRGLRPPDLVKIDVEGAEPAVLRGMARTFREHRPIVLCEVDDADPERFEAKRRGCADDLIAAGYDVTELDDSYASDRWLVGHLLARPR